MANDKFTMSVGLAHELEMAFGRTGWSASEVKELTHGDILSEIRLLANMVGGDSKDWFGLRYMLKNGSIWKDGDVLHVRPGCPCGLPGLMEDFECWARTLVEYFEVKSLVFHRKLPSLVASLVGGIVTTVFDSGTMGSWRDLEPRADSCDVYPIVKGISMTWEFD